MKRELVFMDQLKLFYDNVCYDSVIRTYYFHFAGTGINYVGKRTDDVVYYSTNKYPNHTLSDKTLDDIICEGDMIIP